MFGLVETLIIAGSVILCFVLILVGWAIGVYNSLVSGVQNIKAQWSNIKTEYQRRADLFMNLVTSVKSYKTFEAKTFKEVVEARNGAFGNTKATQAAKMAKLDGVFSKLLAVFEAHPDLKSIQQHNKLSDELRITEDRINVARTDYNDVVREYNLIVKTFPSSYLARIYKYAEEKFFVNEPSTDKAPRIVLD